MDGRLCSGWRTLVSTLHQLDRRLMEVDLDEPSAVDDVYISVETGIGVQPPDSPSVMAGFVAAVRLHMILERT